MKKWLTKILNWLLVRDPRCECERPRWRVLLEHYPSYAKDLWQCDRCKRTAIYGDDDVPVEVKTEICSLGHIHIVN